MIIGLGIHVDILLKKHNEIYGEKCQSHPTTLIENGQRNTKPLPVLETREVIYPYVTNSEEALPSRVQTVSLAK